MLEQRVTREAIIGGHSEIMERGFRLIQQRVCGCHCISHMMEMLIAPALRNCLLNLSFRNGGVTGVCCQQRLHRRKRAAAVWRPSSQQLIDSFLGLLVPSDVL